MSETRAASTELIFTPINEPINEEAPQSEYAAMYARSQLHEIEDRLARIEDMVAKIHKTLDIAFTRFEAMTKSPILGTMLGAMTKGK
jgi:hypothetical protein